MTLPHEPNGERHQRCGQSSTSTGARFRVATNGSTLSSLPEVWELPQDQMTKAESVPTRKAAHCDEEEIQSNDHRYPVRNVDMTNLLVLVNCS
jgi:hypothetical protein